MSLTAITLSVSMTGLVLISPATSLQNKQSLLVIYLNLKPVSFIKNFAFFIMSHQFLIFDIYYFIFNIALKLSPKSLSFHQSRALLPSLSDSYSNRFSEALLMSAKTKLLGSLSYIRAHKRGSSQH